MNNKITFPTKEESYEDALKDANPKLVSAISKEHVVNSDVLEPLLKEATEIYNKNFDGTTWFGRCIFLSWYCEVGTCKFCYRSTQKSRIARKKDARRSLSSMAVEAIFAKFFDWRIEFLTGGYKSFEPEEMFDVIKTISKIYKDKLWLNMGALEKSDIDKYLPYLEGVCASIECINSELHNMVCPNKPIKPYEEMFKYIDEINKKLESEGKEKIRKSMTIVIGLGEEKKHLDDLFNFIETNGIDRITFYGLKPIKGTPYQKSPDKSWYAYWVAKTRIKFPTIEIITGMSLSMADYGNILIRAGSNAITKFPATKQWDSEVAKKLESDVSFDGRNFISKLSGNLDYDFDSYIDGLDVSDELKNAIKLRVKDYVSAMAGKKLVWKAQRKGL
jgi:biotin synthase-like enzyme